MTDFAIRKITAITEEIRHEFGPPPATPRRRAAVLCIASNPYAGRYEAELQSGMEALKPLGQEMAAKLIGLFGADKTLIDGYGKGAIVGTAGEIEHGALWHVPGGYAMREQLGEALAIVPSAMKVGAYGATLDVPLGHKDAAYVRSHFDAMTLGVPDGPRPDEIVFILAMSIGGRVHDRMGGLRADQISVRDGQR